MPFSAEGLDLHGKCCTTIVIIESSIEGHVPSCAATFITTEMAKNVFKPQGTP